MAKTVATKNNADNVSSSKGVKGGYIFSAPVGTELPKDIKTPLNEAFKVLGYISSDGYKETIDSDSEDILDMNGEAPGLAQDLPRRIRPSYLRGDQGRDAEDPVRREERHRRERNHHRPPQRRFRDHPAATSSNWC